MNGALSERSMTRSTYLLKVSPFFCLTSMSGMHALKLAPDTAGEGILWNFIGIFSRNREEWAVVDLACLRSNITIVPFYDSLGKEALTHVINLTDLTTMCIEKGSF